MWHHPGVRLAVMLALFTALTGQSMQYVAAAIASDGFGRDSTDSAVLMTALGLGALLASLFAGRLARRRSRYWMVVCALAMYVAAPLIVASGEVFAVAVVGYFVSGLAHFTFAVQVNSLIQLETPDQLAGACDLVLPVGDPHRNRRRPTRHGNADRRDRRAGHAQRRRCARGDRERLGDRERSVACVRPGTRSAPGTDDQRVNVTGKAWMPRTNDEWLYTGSKLGSARRRSCRRVSSSVKITRSSRRASCAPRQRCGPNPNER